MMLSAEEAAAVLEVGFAGDCYIDPVLGNNPRKYHEFISDLIDCNILTFTDSPRVQVGVFVVTKKQQRQRLIIDARRSNRLFRSPPTTCLGSVESWTRLEVQGGGPLFMAQEDVKDYFYRLGISRELGEYFSLPAIDPQLLLEVRGSLPPDLVALVDVSGARLHPCLKVLPMGFSWAFHLAHEAHVEVARRVLTKTPVVRDRRPPPRIGCEDGEHTSAMLIYADNCNHLGIDRIQVDDEQARVREELRKHGLDTHDVISGSLMVESLGVRIDGMCGKVQATPNRDWRLDRALRACQASPALSGEELEVLIGHMTSRALLHRGLMGILRPSYTFVRSNYTRRRRLWDSVRHELELFRCLMPLALCTDACPSGYAVCESDWSAHEAAEVGREDERWRYYRGPVDRPGPRAAALDTGLVFEDPLTVKPEVDGELFGDICEDPSFPEVHQSLMTPSRWHVLWGSPIRWSDAIHVLEARSVLGAIKHRCRDSERHGKRITVLNDNLGVVLAVQKGRCANYGILRIIRRIAAHCLATGIRLHVRWVPSEVNVADQPSRWWEPDGPPSFPSGQIKRAGQGIEEESVSPYRAGGQEGEREDEKSRARGCLRQEGNLPQQEPIPCGRGKSDTGSSLKEATPEPQKADGKGEAKTERDYFNRLEKFYGFARFHQIDIKVESKLDEALCDYADHLYLNGESSTAGQKLQAALEYVRPECVRGKDELAIFNEVSFSTYGRPGELLKMKAEDYVEKNQDYRYPVLILGDVRVPWLDTVLRAHVKQRLRQDGVEANLWSFTAKQYLESWRKAVEILEVEEVAKSRYQNRHGGASRDHLLRLRSVQAIQRRGRWASDSSARIYDKPGRLQQVLNKHDGGRLKEFGEAVRAHFGDWYRSGSCRVPKDIRKRVQTLSKGALCIFMRLVLICLVTLGVAPEELHVIPISQALYVDSIILM
ncbi:unnamed protein product [Symbiodinium sp. CCMP2592]|nr:unnamed protein product [Symbiodinium sp. CCMP2592]